MINIFGCINCAAFLYDLCKQFSSLKFPPFRSKLDGQQNVGLKSMMHVLSVMGDKLTEEEVDEMQKEVKSECMVSNGIVMFRVREQGFGKSIGPWRLWRSVPCPRRFQDRAEHRSLWSSAQVVSRRPRCSFSSSRIVWTYSPPSPFQVAWIFPKCEKCCYRNYDALRPFHAEDGCGSFALSRHQSVFESYTAVSSSLDRWSIRVDESQEGATDRPHRVFCSYMKRIGIF